MLSSNPAPVLILGAGINGCAVARELLLNGVSICLVDTADIAFGATARSSRLIHGGLRYLEYGEVDLVRESLEERTRLLRLAPQYVRPIRLFIPVATRLRGLIGAIRRFLRLEGGAPRQGWLARLFAPSFAPRGLWLVRLGLWMYDRYAGDPLLPKHQLHALGEANVPKVDSAKYRWLCSYYDAQMVYPERFVLALLEDARRIAEDKALPLQVFTYHRVALTGEVAEVFSNNNDSKPVLRFQPSAIINATGAWGDATLAQMGVPSRRLFGGTKGSHFLSSNPRLREALAGQAVYAQAADGRLVFLLPLDGNVLVGTTDEPFEESPEQAVASREELAYLVRLVNDVFPQVKLTIDDIDMHYSGVRPLPYRTDAAPSSITRRHWIEKSQAGTIPVFTLIGGKLTTCRSLAEQTADMVLSRLGMPRAASSRERLIPGGEDYPPDQDVLLKEWDRLAAEFGLEREQIQAIWSLCGTRMRQILGELDDLPAETLCDTLLPLAFVRWVIRHEWVTTLDDLIERRLMLLYQPRLSVRCLQQLAQLLVEEGLMRSQDTAQEVCRNEERLRTVYGKALVTDASPQVCTSP